MKTKTIAFSFLLSFFLLSTPVWAIPYLQLDIEGGTYVGGEDETVYAQAGVFTLYGLVASEKGPLDDVFYISAALVSNMLEPIEENSTGNYGSFSFNGTTFQVTADMIYGTPPIGAAKNTNLPDHGIFPTFFKEFSFADHVLFPTADYNFYDGSADEYDAQEDWGGTAGGLTPNPDGPLYYSMFSVDTSALNADYAIHFDLYTKNIDGTLNEFAPFSHDAQSGPPVPEPATMVLFGTGLAGLAAMRRKNAERQS